MSDLTKSALSEKSLKVSIQNPNYLAMTYWFIGAGNAVHYFTKHMQHDPWTTQVLMAIVLAVFWPMDIGWYLEGLQ